MSSQPEKAGIADIAEPTDVRHHRQRLAPEERRGEILNAALSVFSDLGYTNATLNDVADHLGVTKGCLYHYFDSKEQLLRELIHDRVCSSIIADDALLGSGGSRAEALRALLERFWQHFQEPGRIEVAILAINELPKVPEGGQFLFDEVVTRSRQTLRQVLQRNNRCDEVSTDEIERAAKVIPLMILGVAMGSRIFRSIDPVQFSPEQVGHTVTTILLHGLSGACPDEANSGS
jgi:AcrR family transcriptional regulator